MPQPPPRATSTAGSTQPSISSRRRWSRGDGGTTVKSASLHLHPARGIRVKDTTFEGLRTVEWTDFSLGVEKTYDSASNSIITVDLPDDEKGADALTEKVDRELRTGKKATAWQIGQTLFAMPTLDGITALVDYGWCGVSSARDGLNDRYILTFDRDRLEDPAEASKASLVLLVDHKSGLLQKWMATFPDVKLSLTFTYNDPVFRDISDVNIPADAKIGQRAHATSVDASAVLNRLDRLAHSDDALGTYTALITETCNYPAKSPPGRGMRLFGRNNASQFHGFYRNETQAPFLQNLSGWPVPDVAATVAAAADTVPDVTMVSDGTASWTGYAGPDGQVSWSPITPEDRKREPFDWGLTAHIWPSRQLIDFKHGSHIKIDIQALSSPDRPGQVGIQVDESGPVIQTMQYGLIRYVWWLDPARNDVPVEKVSQSHDMDGRLLIEEIKQSSEYSQLPSGLWYPTAWTTQEIKYDSDGQRHVACTRQARLQLVVGMSLPSAWFADPRDRFPPTSSPYPRKAPTPATQPAPPG